MHLDMPRVTTHETLPVALHMESTNFEHAWLRLMRMGRTGLSAPAILRPLALSSPERH